MPRQMVRRIMRSPEEDDRLESCDDPVPLAEPPRLPVPRNMDLLPPGDPTGP